MVIPLNVVKAAPDSRVIEALQQLLLEAKAGRITGLAYVALEPGHGFTADVLGSVVESRVLALGITQVLKETVLKLPR